jgi:hypothetical protein
MCHLQPMPRDRTHWAHRDISMPEGFQGLMAYELHQAQISRGQARKHGTERLPHRATPSNEKGKGNSITRRILLQPSLRLGEFLFGMSFSLCQTSSLQSTTSLENHTLRNLGNEDWGSAKGKIPPSWTFARSILGLLGSKSATTGRPSSFYSVPTTMTQGRGGGITSPQHNPD